MFLLTNKDCILLHISKYFFQTKEAINRYIWPKLAMHALPNINPLLT